MASLEWLLLFGNRLTGPIPSSVGLLSGMLQLNLHGNLLASTIPTELGQLNRMNWLSVEGNNLSGTIPSELGLLTSLTTVLDLVRGCRYNDYFGG